MASFKQSGGYDDAMFINPPDQSSGLLCPVCILVLREPHLMSCCGKHLCKMCLARVEDVKNPCPCCNNPEFQTLFDKGKNNIILGLKVYCSNRGSGCNWTGELGDRNEHVQAKCDFILEICPYGCGQCVPRHSIPKHTERECSKRPIEVQLKCMEEKLRAIELNYEEKITELERSNTALQARVKQQERKLDKQEKEFMKQLSDFKGDFHQLREVQKNNEDRLTTLKSSSDLCINELRKMEKQLKDLSCDEVIFPVCSLGKIKYFKMLELKGQVIRSRVRKSIVSKFDDIFVTEHLEGPNPGIKVCNIPLHQRIAEVKSEVTKIVSSIEAEIVWFPPEKEEVCRYFFGKDGEEGGKNWENTSGSSTNIYFISSMKPFTVEVCGRNRDEVKKAVDELKSFRDNIPVEIKIAILSTDLYKVEQFAASKSVSLNKADKSPKINNDVTRSRNPSTSYSIFTLKGGKYDVQLVQDLIQAERGQSGPYSSWIY